MHNVVIIGGGPSGLKAGASLTKENPKVLIVDKKKEIGEHIVCMGIMRREAFNRLDLSCDALASGAELKFQSEVVDITADNNHEFALFWHCSRSG
jgi:flavin-dependent dehydrogenase